MAESKKSIKGLSKDAADTSKVQGGKVLRANDIPAERTFSEGQNVGEEVDRSFLRRGDKFGNTED